MEKSMVACELLVDGVCPSFDTAAMLLIHAGFPLAAKLGVQGSFATMDAEPCLRIYQRLRET